MKREGRVRGVSICSAYYGIQLVWDCGNLSLHYNYYNEDTFVWREGRGESGQRREEQRGKGRIAG